MGPVLILGLPPAAPRLRLDIWALMESASGSCCGDVAAVDGLRLPVSETPLLVLLELRPLLMLALSEAVSVEDPAGAGAVASDGAWLLGDIGVVWG
jgi:hypothetical protein